MVTVIMTVLLMAEALVGLIVISVAQVEESLIEAQQNLRKGISGLSNPVRTAVLGLANRIAVLVLPAWLLLVLRDQCLARDAINRRVPSAAQADF